MAKQLSNKNNENKWLAKDIVYYLLVSGGILTALSISPALIAPALVFAEADKISKRKLQNTFYYLRKNGIIEVESEKGNIHISLTPKGKRRANKYRHHYQLKRKIQKRWDGKWRIVLFDIDIHNKLKRDALRSMLRKLGFRLFQKSAWIYPYDCRRELRQLQGFFAVSNSEVKLVIAEDVGDDKQLKKFFALKP